MLESRTMFKLLHTILLLVTVEMAVAGGVYLEPDKFIQQSFGDHPPAVQVLWLNKELKQELQAILQHPYKGLRIRYWREGERRAWILDEIGKTKPITTGVVVNNNRIELIRVLTFRESRGWEVRHDFFTKQFEQAELTDSNTLNKAIDNISGATLSVRALTKVARIALLLHNTVMLADKQQP
jgi:hypothetical protein